ncbi:MAG: hypothetical protein V1932_04045 [Chloroflexota bacterium]
MARSLLTLSIEGMSLKLLASRGERVLAWSITPINPRFFKGGFVANRQGLASVIRTAVNKKEFSQRHRVLASIPAFHSVCRTLELPNLPEVRPDVAIPQQARRDFGYSAENSILHWKPLASAGGRPRFFIISVPREPVITLIETFKLAGLQPDNIETTTFALSRAVNQSQAVIVAVEPNSLDSIILKDGIPGATRSTFWGERPQEPESLTTLATGALDSIISFHNESYPDDPVSPDIPVYLFGSAIVAAPNIVSAVETTLERPVSEFMPPVLYPQDFLKAEFAVNIGLMLKEL